MLPANMAKVGAISLLSWGVTALGSMAIAYCIRPGWTCLISDPEACRHTQKTLKANLVSSSRSISTSSPWRSGTWQLRSPRSGYLATFFPVALIDPDCHMRRGNWVGLADYGGQLRRSECNWTPRCGDGLGSDSPGRPSLNHRLVLVQRSHLRRCLESTRNRDRKGSRVRASRSLYGHSLAWSRQRKTRLPWRIRKKNVPLACMLGTHWCGCRLHPLHYRNSRHRSKRRVDRHRRAHSAWLT